MGRGWQTSLLFIPVRCAALRNPGYGSRKLSILKLNRKAKHLSGSSYENRTPEDAEIKPPRVFTVALGGF